MTDQELMRVHVETLFTHGPDGRMLRVNEPNGKDAPRFFLGRTIHGNDWRFRHDIDDDLRRELESLCRAAPATGELRSTTFDEMILSRFEPVGRTWAGPAYRFPSELPTSAAVRITEENRDLLSPYLEAWLDDVAVGKPMFVSLLGGRAVSICCSVRMTSVAHEVGVETVPEFRGRGFATPVVAAWASAVRDLNRIPLYSTSWQNDASQAVARKLGLIQYGADLHIT